MTLAQYQADFVAPAKCTNLADFLLRPPRIVALMQDRRGLEVIVADLFDQLAADGVVYAEMRFAPYLHTDGELAPAEVVEIVNAAVERGSADSGVEARLILCTLRHFDAGTSLATAQLVERFHSSLVVALDIAGDEAGYPLDAHEAAFRYAEEHGLRRTAHAGEASGPQSVWETLRRLRPERIGHGARSIEDASLVDHLRADRRSTSRYVHRRTCRPTCATPTPTTRSTRSTAAASRSASTPTAGRVTDITLEREYERLRATFGWTDADLARCNRAALAASFAPDDVRARVAARLAAGIPAWHLIQSGSSR